MTRRRPDHHAGDPALPGLDVPRLPCARDRRGARRRRRISCRASPSQPRCGRSTRASSAARAPCGRCSPPTWRSASSRRCSCSSQAVLHRRRRGARVRRRVARRAHDAARPARRGRGRARRGGLGLRGRRPAGGDGRALGRCGSTSSSGGSATSRRRSTARESAEIATVAVAGVDALETTFARYLPQLVLAVVVPVAVLVFVATIDLVSAGRDAADAAARPGLHVARRPLHRAARARALAGARAASPAHFLDVVRGLPTLRAFNRGEAQAEQIARGRATSTAARRWATLRVAFLSGTVLELAATLGIALVAVTVGVRLVEGGIGFEAGLTVLVLAPELYLPLRNLAAQFHASADGLAVAERLLELARRRRRRRRRPARRVRRARASAPVRLEGVSFAYPARPGVVLDASRPRARARARRSRSSARAASGKSTIASLLLRLAEPTRRPRHRRRRRSRGVRRRPPGARRSRGCRSGRRSSAAPSPTTSGSATPAPATATSRDRGRARRRRRASSASCPTGTRRSSATAAGRSRPASCSGSRSRARSSATRRS